ncbi:MAG TPA: ATP-dependent helicase [Methanosarcinaceae archaeon]|nr:ATP-dependent helicase [Methanosarcinaceae archaeon]HJH31365.1 ATP-dependent helicase [Methanosarcinaceae archaeon]
MSTKKDAGKKLIDMNLDAQQAQAIQNLDGPMLILASAGTGKTRTLMAKVAALLEKSVPPNEIMLVTFTNKATNEMRSRLIAMGYDIRNMWIGTFHNICNRILRENYSRIPDLNSKYTIIMPDDCRKLVNRIIKDMELEDNDLKPTDAFEIISFAKNAMQYDPAHKFLDNIEYSIDDVIEYKYPKHKRYIKLIQKIHRKYHTTKLGNNVIDFDDMLVYALYIVSTNETLREKYERQFEYILVDEYQDTNNVQAALIRQLRKNNMNITAVGDEAQAIYEWRAATPGHIIAFPHAFEGTKILNLTQNYRSTPQIINAAIASINHNKIRLEEKQMNATLDDGELPTVSLHMNIYDELEYIADRIYGHIQNGIAPNKIAVLARTFQMNKTGIHHVLGRRLLTYGIQYVVFGGKDLFDKKHIRDFIAFLELVYNPRNMIAWERFLGILPGIGPKNVRITILYLQNEPEKSLTGIKLKSTKAKASIKLLNTVLTEVRTRSQQSNVSLMDFLEPFLKIYTSSPPAKKDDFPARVKELEETLQELNDMPIDEFLHEVQLKGKSKANKANVPDDHVIISTIHQAKGLEWDVVHIAGCNEDILPHYRSIVGLNTVAGPVEHENKDESGIMIGNNPIEEERRLFYVAVTRAKKILELTMSESTPWGKPLCPSRFIVEVQECVVQETDTGVFELDPSNFLSM